MPLTGRYEPSPSARSAKQVELYEATNGQEGGHLRGRPVIVLTSVGAKTGKLRKIPLMRVEHEGVYAVRGRVTRRCPEEPRLVLQPQEEPESRAAGRRDQARLHRPRGDGRREDGLVGAGGANVARLRELPDENGPADPGIRARSGDVTQLMRLTHVGARA